MSTDRKAILLIGEPGTGKTSLTKTLLADMMLSDKHYVTRTIAFPVPYTGVQMNPVGDPEMCVWAFLGKFDGQGYAQGTDRLSMGIQPVFKEWSESRVQGRQYNLFIEGDRLANKKTIQHLSDIGCEVSVIVLTASDEIKWQRYRDRGSNQADSFLKGRATKIRNLVEWMSLTPPVGVRCMVLNSETQGNADMNLRYLKNIIGPHLFKANS